MKEDYKTYLTSVEEFSKSKNEPAWMQKRRKDALLQMNELELPKIERVKYNRWPLFDFDMNNLSVENQGEASLDLPEKISHPTLIQYANKTIEEYLPKDLKEAGVIFTDIFTAFEKYPDLVEKYYMTKAVKSDEDKLTAAHTAFMNSGVFLYVPKGVVISEPVESLFYTDASQDHDFKHILIVADENSQLTYLERFQDVGDSNEKVAANIIVEVVAKQGAQVKFSAIDQLGKNYTTYMNRRGHLERDASIEWAIGIMNNGNVVADFDSDLVGDGSHASIKAVAVSTGKQVQGVDTRVTNFGKNSVGHILQHGVILESGTLTFNGIGHIIRGAKGADAQQESRVLMLSDKARSDANPILLIDENDVTAGHAASIGQVDPEDMYYLMSRGLDQDTAERLIIRGFLGSVISEIPVKDVQKEMVNVIERKLDLR